MSEVKNELKEFYNKYANYRNKSRKQDWKIDARKDFLEILKLERAKTLLEVGAGTGQDSQFFIEENIVVTAIDLSESHVHYCQERGINAQVMDLYDLQFKDNSFDSIYTLNTLLHIPKTDLPDVLNELKRVLKQNGLIYIGVYGGRDFEGKNENDKFPEKRFFVYYPYKEYQNILKGYFEIIKSERISLENDFEFHYFIMKNNIS